MSVPILGNGMPSGLPGGLVLPRLELGPYDDLFQGVTLKSKWTIKGSGTTATVSGNKCQLYMPSQGHGIYQVTAGPLVAGNFRFMAHIKSLTNDNGCMPSILASDDSGNGVAWSPYQGTSYTWAISSDWAYSGTGSNTGGVAESDYWCELSRISGLWGIRFAGSGFTNWLAVGWGAQTSLGSWGGTVARIGLGDIYSSSPVTMDLHEFRFEKLR